MATGEGRSGALFYPLIQGGEFHLARRAIVRRGRVQKDENSHLTTPGVLVTRTVCAAQTLR